MFLGTCEYIFQTSIESALHELIDTGNLWIDRAESEYAGRERESLVREKERV